MGYFKVIGERCSVIRFLVKMQKTAWYPFLFACLCAVSGTHDYHTYLPIFGTLCLSVVFAALFTDDNKVFLMPMLAIYYSLGIDNGPLSFSSSNGDMLAAFDPTAFIFVCVFGAVAVGAFIMRLAADGSIVSAFTKRRGLTFSIIALDIAFILNGLFSPVSTPVNLIHGAVIAMGLTLFYFLTHGMLDRSHDFIPYACKAMVGAAYAALLQFAIIAYRLWQDGHFFIYVSAGVIDRVNRITLTLSWGVATVIAAVFVLGIPAAMYLAKNCKHSWFSYLSAILFIFGTIAIDTRSAMLIGIVTFIVCAVICCTSGKNKKLNRIYTAVVAASALSAMIFLLIKVGSIQKPIDKLLDILRFDTFFQSGRWDLWENGINDFLSAPIFGVGFNDGGYSATESSNNIYSNMYHCILIEFIGATGLVGAAAFLFHMYQLARLFFKKMSADKALLMLLPIMIIGMSFVDNFFFYLNFQIFYCVFLVMAEKCDEQARLSTASNGKNSVMEA